MAEPAWTWTLKTEIASSVDDGHLVIEKLLSALTEHGWDGRDFFHVQMAAEEAMVNAVKHGNRESGEKKVEIEFGVSSERVYMRFKDEGEGFSPDDLPDPREDEHLESTNGRGVMLINEMMCEVRYNDRGNQVEMWKSRSSSPPAASE